MIFQHTHDWITGVSPHTGEPKTQTRRIARIMDAAAPDLAAIKSVWRNGRAGEYVAYQVGDAYAVQPGRGKSAVGRIRITDIRKEDVRDISDADVRAEGFGNVAKFLCTWCSMHDKSIDFSFDWQMVDWRLRIGRKRELASWDTVLKALRTRPDERYQAWVLTIEFVNLKEDSHAK